MTRTVPSKTRCGPPVLVAVLLAFGAGAPARAGAAEPPPSPAVRAAYWLDRVVKGPEPTTYAIPNFHHTLLEDAVANLAATPDETLALLADDALRTRLTTQGDANPWHAILEVLRIVGAKRPEVARAWALPALSNALLTLRRAAIPPLAALRSPEDAPALLAALEHDADDRVVGPAAARALLALGPPFDTLAARVAYERGVSDGSGGGSALWDPWADAVLESKTRGAPDLLSWWAALTPVAGPRAKPPQGARGREGSPAAEVASADDLLGVGRGAAAHARIALAEAGFAAYLPTLALEAASPDPMIARFAREVRRRLATPAERPAVRAEARAFLNDAGPASAEGPWVEDARSWIRTLKRDDDPEATALLLRFVLETPAAARQAMGEAYLALVDRGAEPVREAAALLASADPASVDRAVELIKRSSNAAYLAPLIAWLDAPATAPRRGQGRRVALLVVTQALAHGGLELEVLSAWVRRVVDWSQDRTDPSAKGLLGTLLDLGPPGLAALGDGLRGPDREAYLALLQRRTARPLPPSVVDAILAPVDRDTPTPARRRALDAAFFVAGGDSAEGVRALARRLDGDARADAETVARIVAHRVPSAR